MHELRFIRRKPYFSDLLFHLFWHLQWWWSKVEIFLEQREVAFLSPSKICENLNFSTFHPEKFKFSQILLGDKNITYLCSKLFLLYQKRCSWGKTNCPTYLAQKLQFQTILFLYKLCVTEKRTHVNTSSEDFVVNTLW